MLTPTPCSSVAVPPISKAHGRPVRSAPSPGRRRLGRLGSDDCVGKLVRAHVARELSTRPRAKPSRSSGTAAVRNSQLYASSPSSVMALLRIRLEISPLVVRVVSPLGPSAGSPPREAVRLCVLVERLDEFDLVPVGVADERRPSVRFRLIARLLDDAVMVDRRERLVNVVDP